MPRRRRDGRRKRKIASCAAYIASRRIWSPRRLRSTPIPPYRSSEAGKSRIQFHVGESGTPFVNHGCLGPPSRGCPGGLGGGDGRHPLSRAPLRSLIAIESGSGQSPRASSFFFEPSPSKHPSPSYDRCGCLSLPVIDPIQSYAKPIRWRHGARCSRLLAISNSPSAEAVRAKKKGGRIHSATTHIGGVFGSRNQVS